MLRGWMMKKLDKKLIYLKEYVEKNPNAISLLNENDKKLLIEYYENLVQMKKIENFNLKRKLR